MSVTSEITSAATYTAQEQASQPKVTGTASAALTSTQFLNLMLKQLQFQDPMEPQDNSQFVSQQCQFSQLSTTQEMKSNIVSNNGAMQASSLVGENVVLKDPNDNTKTITGKVTSAKINGENSAIEVNGKYYPLSTLKYVNSQTTATTQ